MIAAAVLALVVAIVIINVMFHRNNISQLQVIQSFTGSTEIRTKGGIYFGKTTEWLSWGSTSMSSDMPKIAVLEGVSNWGDYSTISGVSVATNADDSVTILCTGTYGGYSSHPVEFSVTFSPDNTVRLAYGEDCIYGGYVAWSNGSEDTTTQV